MKEKYYTPTKQELIEHVINGETLYAEVYGTSNLLELEGESTFSNFMDFLKAHGNVSDNEVYGIDASYFRVKYLDKKDIEDEGCRLWQIPGDSFDWEFNLDYGESGIGSVTFDDNGTVDELELFGVTFHIKNASEFKKLLKQLNIK